MARAQAALEFIILATVMVLILTLTTALFQIKLNRDAQAMKYREISGLLTYIENEFRLAQEANPGYERIINLPPTIAGMNYSIILDSSSNELVISIGDTDFILYYDANIQGDMSIGRNKIVKTDTGIIITPLS